MTAGLTGGIGSGKSTVARLFELMGCAVFSSDEAAKSAYFDAPVRQAVTALLGQEAYLAANTLNKAYISATVFSDPLLLQQLNGIIHPAVKQAFLKFSGQQHSRIIIKETALLFETGLDKDVDRSIVVAAPEAMRVARVMARDGSSHEEVLKKMNSQMTQEEKISRADFVIWNNGEESLIEQVLAVKTKLENAFTI